MSNDATPRLGLPWLMPAQAQKHVTVNESLGIRTPDVEDATPQDVAFAIRLLWLHFAKQHRIQIPWKELGLLSASMHSLKSYFRNRRM